MDRDKQNILYMVIGAVGIFLIIIVAWQMFQSNEYHTYKGQGNAFSIKYPAQWTATPNFQGAAVVFTSPLSNDLDTFSENITIVVQDLSANPMSLKKYTDTAINQMKVVFKSNLIVIDEGSFYLSGMPGYKFTYIGKAETTEIQMMNTWTIKDNVAYQVSYTALESGYEDFIDEAEKMISSFKINR